MPVLSNSAAVGSRLAGSTPQTLRLRAGLTTLGLLAVGLTVVVLASANVAALPATARFAGVAVPVAFALYRLAREASDRFALLLFAAGSMWSVTTLAESDNAALYSIGRLFAWLVGAMLVLLILSFPGGRLTTVTQRRLAVAAVALVALLYLPSALLGPFPEPSPWASCDSGCPANALQLTDGTTAFAQDVLRPARELLAVVLFALAALEVIRRSRGGSTMMRQVLAPVGAMALLQTAALLVYFAERSGGGSSAFADGLAWVYALSLPAITLAFVAGSLAHRLFVAEALERLTQTLASRPSGRELRKTLADALGDPSLEIRFAVPESPSGWIEETGWPAAEPVAERGRAITEVRAEERLLAAIVHDGALLQDRALLAGVSSYTVTALENQQLLGELRSSLEELTKSRARLVAVADQERRAIERDLHDGAQQRLVALQIKLALLADELEGRSPENAQHVRAFEEDVEATLDEVRRFGRGLYPALLADRGLSDALHAVARSAAVPTIVHADLPHRYPRETESAVYFACLEALQNVSKHARGATSVGISLTGNGSLRFDVRDNGAGFDPASTPRGAGLVNMRDRIGALGGDLWISSRPGRGTCVSGTVPTEAADRG